MPGNVHSEQTFIIIKSKSSGKNESGLILEGRNPQEISETAFSGCTWINTSFSSLIDSKWSKRVDLMFVCFLGFGNLGLGELAFLPGEAL